MKTWFQNFHHQHPLITYIGLGIAFLSLLIAYLAYRKSKILTGGIYAVIESEFVGGIKERQDLEPLRVTIFTPYIELVNDGNATILLKDIQLEVEVNNKYVKLGRELNLDNVLSNHSPNSLNSKEYKFYDELLYRKYKPLEIAPNGVMSGWLYFYGDKTLFDIYLHKYRLTCIDNNNKEYVLKQI